MGKITVTAKTPTENLEAKISIEERSTVKKLIQKVAPEFNFDPEHSVIMFRGDELSPDQTLEEAGVQDGFAVLALPKGLPRLVSVTVRNSQNKVSHVQIEPTATVGNLLEMVSSDLTLDLEKAIPTFNGAELPHGQTLEDSGIGDNSLVLVSPRIENPSELTQDSSGSYQSENSHVFQTITPADEKALRKMLGHYKANYDSLELKMRNNFLVPKKIVYILLLITGISAALALIWVYS
jgi:hypothetical protein